MLRIAIGILALLFTLSEGRFFGSHAKNNLQSQDASDIAPVAEFAQHEYKGYIYHEGDEYHDNKDGAISGAQMIIRKKIAASLRTHFGKLQSVLTAFADDDGFVREGIVFCGAGRDESGALLEEPTMPANFHEEAARLIEYDGWGVIDDADAADKYNKDQCGKNNCNEGSAVASIANEIRASGYQIHHKDICEAKAASVSLSSRSANMKPYAESKAIVCANPYWYERLQDCIGIATDDAGDGEINCGSKCTIRKNHAGTDADGNTIVIDDAEYEDKMCWVDFDAIPADAGCARPLDDGASDEVNAKSPENIGAEDSINGIRRAMRYSLNAEVSVQTTDYAYFTGCQTDACLSLRQLFAALNGNAQISAFRDLGMEEAAAYWRDQIASIKTYLQSLADTFTDFREVSLDIFPYIENEEIVGCPMGEIEHAMGETGTDTQPLCYEIANTKRKLNEQSRDGQFISRGECACRNGLLSDADSELPITSAVEADYIYLYYTMPEGTDCDDYPTSVSTYCKQTDWHGGDWEETLLALIPNATTTRTKIYPTHSVHGIATTHAEREAEIAERRQAIQDALVGTFPETLDTSCGRIINADSGVRSEASPLLVSNKGGNCFPFPKMHEIIYRLEFETSEQGTGTYINALENGTASGDRVDQRFCAEKVADIELSFRQLAYRFKNADDGGNQLKNEDTFSGNPAFDTHLDYLVYTDEQTYNNGTDQGVLVDRTFCVVNWLKEFGVRTLEDSTGEEFQDPFGLFEKEIAEAVFNTELAQSTKSKVVTDNILIWKAIRKELTTASDDNILDDIAKRAADHYLYVVSTDEDLIEPSTFRDAELVAEEVANFTVQTAELAIEITSEANNMQQTVVEVLQTADETEAETKANDLVQTLLDYVASMTNAGDLSGNAPGGWNSGDNSDWDGEIRLSNGQATCLSTCTDAVNSCALAENEIASGCATSCNKKERIAVRKLFQCTGYACAVNPDCDQNGGEQEGSPFLGQDHCKCYDSNGQEVDAPARRRLHSSRKLISGEFTSALSEPEIGADGNYTCGEHKGYYFPGNCEQITYYKYTGKGCFVKATQSTPEHELYPFDNQGHPVYAHIDQAFCDGDPNTRQWKDDSGSKDWPIDNYGDQYHKLWTRGEEFDSDSDFPKRYIWDTSSGTQPTIQSADDFSQYPPTDTEYAEFLKFRDPYNYILQIKTNGDWDTAMPQLPLCQYENIHGLVTGADGLAGGTKFGKVGGTESCYIGGGQHQRGCMLVYIDPDVNNKGACGDCSVLTGGYHYTGGNSGQSAHEADCEYGTCSKAASLAAGGSGQCPDTGKCNDCFGAADMAPTNELSSAADWAAGIVAMANLKDAVKSNTDQCSTDHGALGNFACDANNANNYENRVQDDKATYAAGNLPADVVVTFPTRTNFTDNIVDYIVGETVIALNAWKADISTSRELIKEYANNRAHAHHENETKTKTDIQAEISKLFDDGLDIQNKLKQSFKILKEYQQNYESNEDFWGDDTLVQWPDTSTYLTETGQTATLATKQGDGEDVSLPVISQDFSLAHFPTADELQVQCQSKIAKLYYDDVTKTYTDFEEEHAAMATNAESGTGDLTLQELFENQRDAFQDVIDACNDTTIAAQYGVDDAHEVNGQKRTQTYIDTIDAACKDQFPFGSAIDCYRQRVESREQHLHNDAFMKSLESVQKGALESIKTRTGTISTTTAAAGDSYIATRNQVAVDIVAEFRTLSAFADGTNDGGLTISEVAAKNADLVWSSASSADKFAYKLSTAAANSRTACIAIRAQAALIIKSAGEALSSAVTICDDTCTVSGVENFITSRKEHEDLASVDNDRNFVNLAAFQKIETDLKAITVNADCYVAGRVQIENMLAATGNTAGGVKDISIQQAGVGGGNPTYKVNCYDGYTLTNGGECELDDCTGNQYTVLASDEYDPHNSNFANDNVAASAAAGGKAVCKNCPAGKKGDANSRLCVKCPANSYNPTSNGNDCLAITAGSVGTPLNGESDGFTGQTACNPGQYQATDGQDNMPVCRSCDYQSYSTDYGSTACIPVDTGHERASDGKSQVQCVAGFSSLGGSHPCASCEQGQISSEDGASGCTQCIAGKYASDFAAGAEPNRGARECTSVPKGYSSNVAETERYEQNDGGHMTKCSGAQYSMHEGETACATCPAGKIVASETIEGDTVQTSCTDCDGEENIQCLDGINKVDCGTTDPNHDDANNRNTHSVYGEWNDDGDAATACAPKSCSCSTDSFTSLGVVQYVADNNDGWKTQAITALGKVALGDVCRLGNGVALGGVGDDNEEGANKAQVAGCSECAQGYGYDVLRDASGNAVQGTKADGTTYDVRICQKCPQGANTAGSGHHKTQCTSETCPSGQGYPQTVFADADVDVPYSYKYSDAQASECQFCNAGEYSDTNSFSDCFTIPSGFQCTEVHNAAGKIDSATDEQLSVPKNSAYGCSQIDLCPAGTFRHNHDAPSKRSRFGRCNPIPAGSYCSKFFADKDGTVATGVTIGCGEISACPAGEYSAGNGAACAAIPKGKRCKSALKIVEGCDTADYGRDALNCNAFEDPNDDTQKIFKIYSHGDAVNVAAGFVNGTDGHLSSTFDLSTTTEPDIGCRDVEYCPAGEYYKEIDGFGSATKMTCKSIPAGTRCSYNNDNTITTGGGVATGDNNIDESSTGCEDVEDCAALHFTDSRKNICNQFTVCGQGERVKTLGVRGTQATGAGSNSECSQCKLPDGNKADYDATYNDDEDVGWNGDDDDGSAFGNGCQDWTPCDPGEYLAVDNFGTITADKGDCQKCSDGVTMSDGTLNKRFYMPSDYLSNGISQEDSNGNGQTGEYTCTPGPTCNEENKGQLPCGSDACGCQTCGAGQSGAYGGECWTCGKGTKDDGTAGSGECANCQENEYQNEEGQTTCKSIGAGDQCKDDNNLKTACQDIEDCPAGSYATDSMHKCVKILPGHDCKTIKTNNANPAEDSTGCEAQEKCAEGQYSTGEQNNCASIPVGHKCSTYYNDDGTVATGVTTGCGAIEACADNEFSSSGSATCTTITDCGAGHYIQTAAGSQEVDSVVRYKSQRVCKDCPIGRFRSTAPETAASTAAEVGTNVCSECSTCAEGYVFVAHTPGSATCDGKGTACNKGCVDGNEVIDGTDKTCIPFACDTDCNPGMATDGTDIADADYNADPTTCQTDEGRFDCGSCRAGYHVDTTGNPHVCVANECGCEYGDGKLTLHTKNDDNDVTCAVDLNDKAAEYNHTIHQDCASCPSSDRVLVTFDGRGRCDTIVCTCANGTPETGDACDLAEASAYGNSKCSACNGGTSNAFVLNDNAECDACEHYEYRIEGGDGHMANCDDKVFVCDDGTATTASESVTDIANLDHGATHCSSCDANYELIDNECVACAAGKYRIENEGQADHMTECEDKEFVCKNGETVVGIAYDVEDVSDSQKASLANGANHCEVCSWVEHANDDESSGYFLNIKAGGNTCDACVTGYKAKGTGLTDPEDGNKYTNEDSCELITCECDNGTPADGEDTGFSGCGSTGAKCSECDTGYDLATSDDVTNNGATHVGQCIKECECAGGTGARGSECYAAGQGDCTQCGSGYGYYVDNDVGVCLECDAFTTIDGIFVPNANDADGTGACALQTCGIGKGFGNTNLGNPMTAEQWSTFHALWTSTSFRGDSTSDGLKCSACPVGQFSGSDTISQCEPVPANKKCSEWIDGGVAGSAGCNATVACTTDSNAASYTVTADECSVASCNNGYTLDGGTCKADCSGTLSTDSSALEFDNNCCTDTDVDCAHGTVCTASCADSTKVADISANGYQNQATCSDGTLTDDIDVSCKLKDGEDCDDETECLSDYCWAYFSGVSDKKCTDVAPPTCSGFASCDTGNHLKDLPADIDCLTGTCTSSVCCEANPTCDDIDGSGDGFELCDTGYQLKSDLTGTCEGATCASSDCCEQIKKCNDIDGSNTLFDGDDCGAGFNGLKTNQDVNCAGDECAASDCCNAVTCDGTGITKDNADRNGDGGGGNATDPVTTTEAYGSTIRLECDKGRTCSGAHEFAVYTCGQDGTFAATTAWNHADSETTCPTELPAGCETNEGQQQPNEGPTRL